MTQRAIDLLALAALTTCLVAGCGGAPGGTGAGGVAAQTAVPFTVVDTGQVLCYNNTVQIAAPAVGQAFYGQDAQFSRNPPRFRNNGNGTVSDLNTGLVWQRDPGTTKVTWASAMAGASSCRLAGYTDWRLPTIKELYSLIDFRGLDVNPNGTTGATPFINTTYFVFHYGTVNAATGERIIDAQECSSTQYVSTTMNGAATVFGVNFADGRLKGYPEGMGRGGVPMTFFCRYVRGPGYGTNSFVDNGNGTITDKNTGLMWLQNDSGAFKAGTNKDGKLNWQQALAWAEGLNFAGHRDWRLPNAKELQSLVDYTRSPATTHSPAISAIFNSTPIIAENGASDFGFYWASTTHASSVPPSGAEAVYVAFGTAFGYMNGAWIDVHGAGAQRCDPKAGNPANYPEGFGPQGDAVRIYNLVRCVRNA
jgi:hypothetical protein